MLTTTNLVAHPVATGLSESVDWATMVRRIFDFLAVHMENLWVSKSCADVSSEHVD